MKITEFIDIIMGNIQSGKHIPNTIMFGNIKVD